MKTEVTEIADKIYRLSTFLPKVGPNGFTFIQFLIDANQPLLFYYGQRALFPLISRNTQACGEGYFRLERSGMLE